MEDFNSAAGEEHENSTNDESPAKLSCGQVVGRTCLLTALGVKLGCPFCQKWPDVNINALASYNVPRFDLRWYLLSRLRGWIGV